MTNVQLNGKQKKTNNIVVAEYQSGDITIDNNELMDAQFFDIDSLDESGPIIPPKGTIAYQLIEWVKQHYQS